MKLAERSEPDASKCHAQTHSSLHNGQILTIFGTSPGCGQGSPQWAAHGSNPEMLIGYGRPSGQQNKTVHDQRFRNNTGEQVKNLAGRKEVNGYSMKLTIPVPVSTKSVPEVLALYHAGGSRNVLFLLLGSPETYGIRGMFEL